MSQKWRSTKGCEGRTVGDIYARGAAGSIAGTFAAGSYLIAALGTVAIIWLIGACLVIMAVLYQRRFWPYYLWLAEFVFLLIIAAAPHSGAKTQAEPCFCAK